MSECRGSQFRSKTSAPYSSERRQMQTQAPRVLILYLLASGSTADLCSDRSIRVLRSLRLLPGHSCPLLFRAVVCSRKVCRPLSAHHLPGSDHPLVSSGVVQLMPNHTIRRLLAADRNEGSVPASQELISTVDPRQYIPTPATRLS